MGVNSIPFKAGSSRAEITCDSCGKAEIVPCNYTGPGDAKNSERKPNVSQARAKAMNLGWSFVKRKLRCPSCEAKRKVIPMTAKVKEKPPEPTRKQRIEIFTMLADVYDIDAGRYQNGDTDETVADVLGVMPGWVSIIREAEFGPDGSNEDIAALAESIQTLTREIEEMRLAASAFIDASEVKLKSVNAISADLERIKKAVGQRVLKRA